MNKLEGYEVMYLLDPEYAEEGLDEKKERLKGIIEGENGKIHSVEEWGKKRLAYEINGLSEGFYLLIEFEAPSESVDDISEMSNVEEGVIRYQLFRNEEVTEPVTS